MKFIYMIETIYVPVAVGRARNPLEEGIELPGRRVIHVIKVGPERRNSEGRERELQVLTEVKL